MLLFDNAETGLRAILDLLDVEEHVIPFPPSFRSSKDSPGEVMRVDLGKYTWLLPSPYLRLPAFA